MNHRDEDRPFERDGRDRKRGEQSEREYQGSSGSGRFYPGGWGFDEDSGAERYGSSGSGGSSYGAAGYGRYSGEGQRNERGYRDYSSEDYGRGWRQGSGGTSRGDQNRYARQGGSSNWRPQREGASYGGYGSTADYGYGSQGRGDYEQGEFGRQDFSPEESAPYYGTGNYSSGGSGLGGGYRGMRGMGAHGSDELVNERRYGAGSAGTFGEWSRDEHRGRDDREHRPGLLGRFFGRGPKGYKRSDERLREDVSEQLMRLGTVDSSDVSIEVADGVVTLQGTVPDRYMKHTIEDLVDRCLGVKDVDNRIRVQRRNWDTSEQGTGTTGTVSTTTATTAKTRKD